MADGIKFNDRELRALHANVSNEMSLYDTNGLYASPKVREHYRLLARMIYKIEVEQGII